MPGSSSNDMSFTYSATIGTVRRTVAQVTALQTTLTPDDVAESIVWMLGQPKMTGQCTLIDAGRAIGGGVKLMERK